MALLKNHGFLLLWPRTTTWDNIENERHEPFNPPVEELATEDPPAATHTLQTQQHPMDRKYPHRCFNCHKKITWKDFVGSNLKISYILMIYGWEQTVKCFWNKLYQQYKQLKKLWRSKYVQFYCCLCYTEVG